MSEAPEGPDYLELTYSERRLPKGDYPARLASLVAGSVLRASKGRLLDAGCGRGEYLRAFAALGFEASGVDGAGSAAKLSADLDIRRADLDEERLPFEDDSFDFVFSKSVVEHLKRPEHLLSECLRVLKPGGRAVVMTPSWRHTQDVFFEDFGHIRPFGRNALSDAMTLAGFRDARADYFRQLPSVWAFPALGFFSRMTALLPLPYRPWERAPWPEGLNKWIRFSKELMLLGTAVK